MGVPTPQCLKTQPTYAHNPSLVQLILHTPYSTRTTTSHPSLFIEQATVCPKRVNTSQVFSFVVGHSKHACESGYTNMSRKSTYTLQESSGHNESNVSFLLRRGLAVELV